ncbi:MAG: DUF2127 domain-containing protein [Bdellovibrio sp.]|nr:DUF2127 domain-containing protein [Bdellovibrio sp.]
MSVSHRRGLHWIACFEAGKGLLVLLLGCGALSLLGHDVHHIAVQIAHHLGLDHGHHYASIFLKLLENVNDKTLQLLALFAAAYSTLRFAEAYGLWKEKNWAKWLAIISGGLYLPFEGMKLVEHFTWFKFAITAGNLVIVIYLVVIKIRD